MTMTSSNSSEACHLSYYEHEAHDLSYYTREADEIDWWCKVHERDECLRGLNEAGQAEYDRGWNTNADLLADDGRGDGLEDNLGSPHFVRGYRELEANHEHHRQSLESDVRRRGGDCPNKRGVLARSGPLAFFS